MADLKQCDVCGGSPANRVEVGIAIDGVVPDSVRTGHTEAADLCEGCRDEGIDGLAQHVKEQLAEQLPIHVQRAAIRRRVEKHAGEVLRTSAKIAAAGGLTLAGGIANPAVSDDDKALHFANVKELADAQEEEDGLVREATRQSDRKAELFKGSLPTKK